MSGNKVQIFPDTISQAFPIFLSQPPFITHTCRSFSALLMHYPGVLVSHVPIHPVLITVKDSLRTLMVGLLSCHPPVVRTSIAPHSVTRRDSFGSCKQNSSKVGSSVSAPPEPPSPPILEKS